MRVWKRGAASGLLLMLPLAAGAGTHTVPGDFSRITDALAAACPGDTVLAGAGTFSPAASGDVFPLALDTDGVLLKGAGMLFTTLDAEGSGSVIRTSGSGIRITGLTVTGGAAVDGGGIAVVGADTEIDHSLITGNTATRDGAGIFVGAGGNPRIHHNVVWANADGDTTDNRDPHGINVVAASTGTVEHNLVGRTDGNGIFFGGTANPSIRNNILYRNGDGERGRGICAVGESPESFVITHNLFWENTLAPLLYRKADGTVGNVTSDEANDSDAADAVYGNIDADPLFPDPGNGDWSVAPGSPLVDAGDPGSPPDPDGTVADIGPFYLDQAPEGPALPVIMAGHPNPFSDRVTVAFLALDRPLRATVTVFDVRGRRVATLLEGREIPETGSLSWDGRDARGLRVPPGAYFVRLRSADGRVSRTVKLLRIP